MNWTSDSSSGTLARQPPVACRWSTVPNNMRSTIMFDTAGLSASEDRSFSIGIFLFARHSFGMSYTSFSYLWIVEFSKFPLRSRSQAAISALFRMARNLRYSSPHKASAGVTAVFYPVWQPSSLYKFQAGIAHADFRGRLEFPRCCDIPWVWRPMLPHLPVSLRDNRMARRIT